MTRMAPAISEKAKRYHDASIAAYKYGLWEDAVDYMTLALEEEPHNINFLDSRAQIYEKNGILGKAAKDALQMIQSHPSSEQGYLRAGKIAYLKKDTVKAIKIYEIGLKNVSNGSPGYLSIQALHTRLAHQHKAKVSAKDQRCIQSLISQTYDILSNLPPELFEVVFTYLPYRTQLATRWVCRRWRMMTSSNPRLWKDLIYDMSLQSKDLTGKRWQDVFQLPQNSVRSLCIDTNLRNVHVVLQHYYTKPIPLQKLVVNTTGRSVVDLVALNGLVSKHESNLTSFSYWADDECNPPFDLVKMRSLRSLKTNCITVCRLLGQLPELRSFSLMPAKGKDDRRPSPIVEIDAVEDIATLKLHSVELANIRLSWQLLAGLLSSDTIAELQLVGITAITPVNETMPFEGRELDTGPAIFNALLNQCSSLRSLKWDMSNYDASNYPLTWRYPNLQELDITFHLTNSDLYKIAENCHALTRISISICSEITALGIAAIARSSKETLRSVSIKKCLGVQPDIVEYLRAVLRPGARITYSQDEGKGSKDAKKIRAW